MAKKSHPAEVKKEFLEDQIKSNSHVLANFSLLVSLMALGVALLLSYPTFVTEPTNHLNEVNRITNIMTGEVKFNSKQASSILEQYDKNKMFSTLEKFPTFGYEASLASGGMDYWRYDSALSLQEAYIYIDRYNSALEMKRQPNELINYVRPINDKLNHFLKEKNKFDDYTVSSADFLWNLYRAAAIAFLIIFLYMGIIINYEGTKEVIIRPILKLMHGSISKIRNNKEND